MSKRLLDNIRINFLQNACFLGFREMCIVLHFIEGIWKPCHWPINLVCIKTLTLSNVHAPFHNLNCRKSFKYFCPFERKWQRGIEQLQDTSTPDSSTFFLLANLWRPASLSPFQILLDFSRHFLKEISRMLCWGWDWFIGRVGGQSPRSTTWPTRYNFSEHFFVVNLSSTFQPFFPCKFYTKVYPLSNFI